MNDPKNTPVKVDKKRTVDEISQRADERANEKNKSSRKTPSTAKKFKSIQPSEGENGQSNLAVNGTASMEVDESQANPENPANPANPDPGLQQPAPDSQPPPITINHNQGSEVLQTPGPETSETTFAGAAPPRRSVGSGPLLPKHTPPLDTFSGLQPRGPKISQVQSGPVQEPLAASSLQIRTPEEVEDPDWLPNPARNKSKLPKVITLSPRNSSSRATSCWVYVSGLSPETEREELEKHMLQAGQVTYIEFDREENGAGTGGAFIEYAHISEATFAIKNLQGTELDGESISVQAIGARLKAEQPVVPSTPGSLNKWKFWLVGLVAVIVGCILLPSDLTKAVVGSGLCYDDNEGKNDPRSDGQQNSFSPTDCKVFMPCPAHGKCRGGRLVACLSPFTPSYEENSRLLHGCQLSKDDSEKIKPFLEFLRSQTKSGICSDVYTFGFMKNRPSFSLDEYETSNNRTSRIQYDYIQEITESFTKIGKDKFALSDFEVANLNLPLECYVPYMARKNILILMFSFVVGEIIIWLTMC